MGITDARVSFDEAALVEVQRLLVELEIDGWLLCDFHGTNPIAGGLLGLPPLTRRFFVYLPAEGRPVALTHRIEQQPWTGWIGENRPYLSWESLEKGIRSLVTRGSTVAVEYSPGNAIPYLDRVPAGMLELFRATGVLPVSSGDLVSSLYSRWSPEGQTSHRRAATILRNVAHSAFAKIGEAIKEGQVPTEWIIREWIRTTLGREGLSIGVDAVVAVNANAANPHYAPSPERHATIGRDDVVLIDLWGKQDIDAVYADQTWMAYVGDRVPDRVQSLWETIRLARDAAVDLIRSRWRSGQTVHGFEVDNAARAIVTERGHGEAFIHRTGHSIDRELHGSGPNIDNLETRDGRRLIPGIGFSIEPGIYYPGEIGLRTEINVFMGPDGAEVTTPSPQVDIHLIPS